MSGEDDAFDIDIYGDEEEVKQEHSADEIDYTYEDEQKAQETTGQAGPDSEQPQSNGNGDAPPASGSAPTGPSLKRKAPDDETEENYSQAPSTNDAPSQPLDPHAQPALKLTDLNWWTTEDDLRAYCSTAGSEASLTDISFGEHRINGKSRGEAYLEFSTPAAAAATKAEVERQNEAGIPKPGGGYIKEKFKVWYMPVGNPFRGKDGGVGDKKFGGAAGRFDNQGGAYNNSYANRGNFQRGGGRGNFNNNRGNFNANGQMGRGGAVGGGQQWGNGGMMNNPAAAAGGFQNPMMNGFTNMPGYGSMGMGNMNGFNMMGRGGMMGGMMPGRGGFQGMNGMSGMNGMNGMGGMGMMGGMNGLNGMNGMNMRGGGGGGGMMGRGGWGGGGSQSPPQQQQQQQQGGAPKRPRME